MQVKKKMRTGIFSVTPVDPITKALELMANNRIRHVLVVSGDDLVGIISDRDIKSHLAVKSSPELDEIDPTADFYSFQDYSTVDEIMTDNPITVNDDDDIIEAARIMVTEKIGALPVLKDDTLVGVISETDILEAFLEMQERESLKSASSSACEDPGAKILKLVARKRPKAKQAKSGLSKYRHRKQTGKKSSGGKSKTKKKITPKGKRK